MSDCCWRAETPNTLPAMSFDISLLNLYGERISIQSWYITYRSSTNGATSVSRRRSLSQAARLQIWAAKVVFILDAESWCHSSNRCLCFRLCFIGQRHITFRCHRCSATRLCLYRSDLLMMCFTGKRKITEPSPPTSFMLPSLSIISTGTDSWRREQTSWAITDTTYVPLHLVSP